MEQTTNTSVYRPKFVRWALLLGIVIILNIFFVVLTALVYPAPEYAIYCPEVLSSPTTAETCYAQNGTWHELTPPAEKPATVSIKEVASGYCDLYAKCQKTFETANDQHALRAFVLMIALGIIAFVIGLLPLGSSIISSGLSYGGVLAFIVGSIWYWGNAGNWVRLGISAVGLVVLLYIGWRHFRD